MIVPSRGRRGFALLAAAALLAAGCGAGSAGPAPAGGGGGLKAARLSFGYGAAVSIGAIGPVAYDPRGGGGLGVLADRGDGAADFSIAAEAFAFPPVRIIPGSDFARVEIVPEDAEGAVDFCTGEARLRLAALFQPVLAGVPRTPFRVALDLTTESAAGETAELRGARLDAFGDLRLVGVARVEATGDPGIDALLGLPADAATSLPARFEIPEGRFACPGEPPRTATAVRFGFGKDASVSLDGLPEVGYDGLDESGDGAITASADGRIDVVFDPEDFVLPRIELIPDPPGAGFLVRLTRYEGSVALCTGRADLVLEATLTPYGFGRALPPIRLIENLTTEQASGEGFALQGERLDAFGNGRLVGVAVAPPTGDPDLDLRLMLPAELALELPFRLALNGSGPLCPLDAAPALR